MTCSFIQIDKLVVRLLVVVNKYRKQLCRVMSVTVSNRRYVKPDAKAIIPITTDSYKNFKIEPLRMYLHFYECFFMFYQLLLYSE